MLVAPKYNGLDLPVYDPDTRVIDPNDLNEAGIRKITEDYALPGFVRAMTIDLPAAAHAPKTMTELLEKTEQELQAVAELCGALVVRHEWGLYALNEDEVDGYYKHYLITNLGMGEEAITLPENHILVAEVNAVRPSSPEAPVSTNGMTQELLETIRTGVEQYYVEGQGTYQLLDMRYDPKWDEQDGPIYTQFVRGIPASISSGETKTYLTDIEPRFALTCG